MPAISICEVGPRDGLQNERVVLAPNVRGELCRRLAAAGLRRVEAVSFVRADKVPTMAHAEAVIAAARAGTGSGRLAGLVLNLRGYDRALLAGVDEVHYGLPVTEESAARNQGTTVTAAMKLGIDLVERAAHDGIPLTIALVAAFGCAFEGPVASDRVVAIGRKLIASGVQELVLADSIGVGVPRQVRELVGALIDGPATIGCHFHNTRNTGYANALAAVEAGASSLDAALGGLGGCPFMPGATGNIATEDLVYLLEGMGYETGIDLDRLRACSAWLAEQVGHPLPGLVATAGDPCGIVPSSSRHD